EGWKALVLTRFLHANRRPLRLKTLCGAYRPRETRSISALTMRSTNPGRLSSSQDFSIGRSISLTRSSSVRALLLSTVLASELNADSTAATVERDNICGAGAA